MDKFYLAPLQTFTNHIYRYSFCKKIYTVDKFFIPFLRIEKNKIRESYKTEINHLKLDNSIPQILCNNIDDCQKLLDYITSHNYKEINLNLGCPYPMVANKKLGSGLIKHSNTVDQILNYIFKNYNLKVSVKTRLGYEDTNEIIELIPVLNNYPIEELVIHPRIGKQLYKGDLFLDDFEKICKNIKHEIVFNGDINSLEDYNLIRNRFGFIKSFMIGRGALNDVFLFHKLKNLSYEKEQLNIFHDEIFYQTVKLYKEENLILQHIKEFWIYFANNFPMDSKISKEIKKCKTVSEYQDILLRLVFN